MTFGENDQIDLTGTEIPEVTDPEVESAELDVIPEPEPEVVTPEPEPTPTAPNPNDFMARMDRLAAMQEQQMLAAQQQAEQQRRQQEEAARPKPLMEQPEWMAEYDALLERAGYDPDARKQLAVKNRELAREEAQAALAPFQQQSQWESRGDTVLREAGHAVRQQYGDMVTDETFNRVAMQVFGSRANVAQALDATNPQAAVTRDMLAKLAIGEAVTSGKYKPGTKATPPPNPRSPARSANPAAPAKTNKELYGDPDYVDGVIADAFNVRKI